MNYMDKKEIVSLAVLGMLIATCLVGLWVFRSSMEASAYNRATGSEVTTWDAMWIELRVQAGPTSKD